MHLTDVEVDMPDVNDEAFTYDKVGNRKTEDGVDGEWAYNENNELLAFANVEYVYDDNGNMTQKKVGTAAVNYIYNAADRLVKVEDDLTSTVIAEYYYDPFGRRLWKDVGGTRTYFFYADEGLVAEYDATGTETRSYGYQPDSTWMTDPLWLKQSNEYYFYQNDHLGTPQKLIGVNGAIVWSARYSSFGKAEVQIETVVNNLRFPGQYFDDETEGYYNWFRYYEVEIGRYLTPDLIRLVGKINLYDYVSNNPLNRIDPYGLHPTQPTSCPVIPNGCGPENPKVFGWRYVNWVVPDQWLWKWNFGPACDFHDICYGTCCRYLTTSEPTECDQESRFLCKLRCDEYFLESMKNICNEWYNGLTWGQSIMGWVVPDLDLASCYLRAEDYFAAVSHFGNNAFNSGQTNCCPIVVWQDWQGFFDFKFQQDGGFNYIYGGVTAVGATK